MGSASDGFENLSLDVAVFDSEFRWTMVWTHEHASGMGPYFAPRDYKLPERTQP